jgi:hypothetical protein
LGQLAWLRQLFSYYQRRLINNNGGQFRDNEAEVRLPLFSKHTTIKSVKQREKERAATRTAERERDMLLQHSGSYYEDYKRSKNRTAPPLEKQRLMTDRGAYISFLEVQLERVSASCLTVDGFNSRIGQVS